VNFDPDRIMTQMVSAAHDLVEQHIVESMSLLQCEEHGSRVTVASEEGKVLLNGQSCCEAFEAQVAAALVEIGASPNVQPDEQDQKPGPPKAFISHASADKERIVRQLDELLRERGFETWLDERDLLPGKQLLQEIFTHGIGKSDVFIVVLSANSIDRAWVREELNNAFLRYIEGSIDYVIPIVLDSVTPPDFLKNTIWETVSDLNRLPMHADRIAATVFGQGPAPTAPPPVYAGIPVHRLPSLTSVDEQLFAAACQQVLDRNFYHPVVSFNELFQFGKSNGMSEEQVAESLAALEQHHYFEEVIHGLGERYACAGRISHHGMELYLTTYRAEEYRSDKTAILSLIVNQNARSSRGIAMTLKCHEAIVQHVLVELEYGGHVIASHHSEGMSIHPNQTIGRVLHDLEGGR
jgi:hypothetical protein